MCAGIDAINKDVKELRNAAQHEMVLSEESEPDSVVSYLTQLKESVEAQMAEAQRINKYQVLFKLGESTCDDLNDTAEEISLKLGLWTGMAEFEALTQAWTGTHFDSLDVVAMEEAVVRFHKAVFKMERGLTPNKLVPRLRAHVDEFRNLLPVVQALRNRALKERHWTKIFEVIGQVRQGDRGASDRRVAGAYAAGLRRNFTATSERLVRCSFWKPADRPVASTTFRPPSKDILCCAAAAADAVLAAADLLAVDPPPPPTPTPQPATLPVPSQLLSCQP